MNHAHSTQSTKRFRWKWLVALAGFLAIAAFFLLSEHRAHFFGFLPYLLLLLCPIFHLFMHGGHGGHSRSGGGNQPPNGESGTGAESAIANSSGHRH